MRAALSQDFKNGMLVLARCWLWKQLPCELKKHIMDFLKEPVQRLDPFSHGIAYGCYDMFVPWMSIHPFCATPQPCEQQRERRITAQKEDEDWKREQRRIQYKPRPEKTKRPINKKKF